MADTSPRERGSAILARHCADMEARRAAARAAATPDVPAAGRVGRRNFAGAELSRLTSSFTSEHVALNRDLQQSLRILRARARHLAKNNDYVKKFLRMVQNHVIGPQGFALSVLALRDDGSIDDNDRRTCERAFARWAKRGTCDVTGRLSFVQVQRLLALHVARDGEALVRRVRRRGVNAFGYALQIVDPVLLDDTYNADFPDGRKIRMGVEVNAEWRPLAYHLLADVENPYAGRRTRVDAADIWHFFVQDEATQVRGFPWLHTAMRRLNDLGAFEEAAVIAARVGASNMGFFVPPESDGDSGTKLATDVEEDGDGNQALIREAEPGAFDTLPAGWDFKKFDPDYPHANFAPFVKACLRGIASGVGADYNTLANDLEGVNYSSIRHGMLETREEWTALQSWFAESFLDPLWPEWLAMGFASGQLDPLPPSKFAKYDAARWQGRRWQWIDPKNDGEARLAEIGNGLNSYSNVLRELGRDPETVWRELEQDVARLKKLGIALPANAAAAPPPAQESAA